MEVASSEEAKLLRYFGVTATVGLLSGVVGLLIIHPDTPGGGGLIIIIAFLVTTVLGALGRIMFKRWLSPTI